jgi:spermidine synthase
MTEEPRLQRNRQTVSLSFTSTLIQSCMRVDDPDELVLDYTRTMMGALLFEPAPKAILMIGLGGGSMLKYLHKHLPDADLTTVEISDAVIALRDDFHLPPDSARSRIVCADGFDFVRHAPRRYDLILIDAFDGQGIPAPLCTPAFYRQVRSALTPGGMMVANVQAETTQARQIRQRIGKVFDMQSISIESDEGGNDIVMAFNDRTLADALLADFSPRWAALDAVHRDTLGVSSTRIERALMLTHRGMP